VVLAHDCRQEGGKVWLVLAWRIVGHLPNFPAIQYMPFLQSIATQIMETTQPHSDGNKKDIICKHSQFSSFQFQNSIVQKI